MSPPSIYFGAGLIGNAKLGAAQSTPEQTQEILDILKAHEVVDIDTSRLYNDGSSEELLGKVKASEQGFNISTKIFPLSNLPRSFLNDWSKNNSNYTHGAKDIHDSCQASLKALGVDQVDIYYLHRPDPKVPYEETLAAINGEYQAGRFKRFGISNYTVEDVELIVKLCEENNWVKPTVFQGMYNAITRNSEKDLFPVLRKHKISFVAYSALAGGFFSMKEDEGEKLTENKRFNKASVFGEMYRGIYWNQKCFGVLKRLQPLAAKNGVEMNELALRWCYHHSALKGEHGDAILFGASSSSQLETNLSDLRKGPLPKDLVDAMEEAWENLREDVAGASPIEVAKGSKFPKEFLGKKGEYE